MKETEEILEILTAMVETYLESAECEKEIKNE